jgi:hypothetical protein
MRSFQKTYRARVLWILGMSLGFQLGLGVALEQWCAALRDPEYLIKLASLRAHLAKRPLDRPLVVLLGSSRVGVNVRPQNLPPWPGPSAHPPLVFNAALCRSNPVLEYLMLRRLLGEAIHPDWVLVEVTPAFFNACAFAGDAVVPQRLRWRELRWIRPYYSRPKVLYRQWLADRLCPAYAYRFTVLSWFAPNLLPPRCLPLPRTGAGWTKRAGFTCPGFATRVIVSATKNGWSWCVRAMPRGFHAFAPRPAPTGPCMSCSAAVAGTRSAWP